MIITKTPFRLSFFGGGSDYPVFYRQHGGCVLGATIDKYCWLVARKNSLFGKPYKIVYAETEEVDCIGEIRHPAVRAVLEDLGHPEKLELYHTSDLPARSGVGSSSAFVVGLVKALVNLYPKETNHIQWDKWGVAQEAIYVEQNILKETVGSQDQILCSFGGFNIIDFPSNGNPIIRPVFDHDFDAKRCAQVLEERLLLFYTGIQRTSSDVASNYVPELNGKYVDSIKQLMDMVGEGAALLRGISRGDNPDLFGKLLDDAWRVKKRLNGVTTPEINNLYDKAWAAGAIGGKILGGGGGGHLLLYVPLEKQIKVRKVLEGLVEVRFHFEYDGASTVYNGGPI